MHPADPIYLEGSSTGVLLIHGFTGTPAVFHDLAHELRDQLGVTVSAPLIAGHGTKPSDLAKTDWHDWYRSVQDAYLDLRKHTVAQHIVGASFGSNLGCVLASQYRVESLTCIGFPRWIEREKAIRAGIPLYKRLVSKTFHKKKSSELFEDARSLLSNDSFSYPSIPLKSVEDFLEFISKVTPHYLYRISIPVLAIQSRKDGVVTKESGPYLMTHVRSEDRGLVWVNEPHHRLHLGDSRDTIGEAIRSFLMGTPAQVIEERLKNH